MDEEVINNIFGLLTIAYFAFSIIVISIVGIKFLIDSIKDKKNMENQGQNKDLLNRRISKWRALPFEQKVNYALRIIALLTGIASIVMFFLMFSEDVAIIWLLLSFISALFIGIWYYLNYQRFTIEQCKKYGVIFIVAGFLSLISPFIAIVLLIAGTILLKNVYDKKEESDTENQIDVLATDNKYEYVINSGLDVLDGFKHLTNDSRIIAAFLCGSIIWEKGGSREHPSYNWHVFRTLLINFDLWKKYDDIKKVDKKAEQLLSLFLKRNDNPNIVYQCIYEHKIDEDITTFESIVENALVPKEFESVLSSCKENLLKAVETINDLESIGVICDAEDASLKAADNFFYAQKEKIKKIAILAGLRMAEFKEDWVDMSLEELIYTADLVKDIGLEDGVRHLVIPRLQDITDLELHKKYQQYEADKRRLFLHKHADMIQKSKFKDNQYQLFPMKGMCAWYLWCGDENITGSKESLLQQAEAGNYEAYNNLATQCEDEEEILKYFHLAADHGSSNAQQNLWVQYYVKKNYEEAMKWMKKAADGGNLYALTNLARSCYWGINIEKDMKTACSCYKQIAQMNWNAPELAGMKEYNKSLIISGNISYWFVKKECEEQHIDICDAQTDSQPKMSKIEEVWNFLDFAKKMGQPKRATLTNNKTGETFEALLFPTPQGDREFTIVAFGSDFGKLTANEISMKRYELCVVKLESGNYYLYDYKSLQVENIVNGFVDDKSNDISF